jgi:dipeptidyl aminopeptidase/acylaminoacyl peptidase
MKKTILIGKCVVVLAFVALMFQTGCKREDGYYKTDEINPATSLNTYEYLKSKPGLYDSLLFLVDKLKMKEVLTDSNITLFAVQNSSFQIAIKNLNDARRLVGKPAIYLKDLANGASGFTVLKDKRKAIADSAHLDTLVSRYAIKGPYLANDFSVGDGLDIVSVRGDYPMHGQRVYADAQGLEKGGSEVIEFSNTKRSLFVAKWSKTTTTSVNIKTKNGLVHLLRPDHIFGFDEFVYRMTVIPPPAVIFDYKADTFYPTFEKSDDFDGQISTGEKMIKALDGNILTKFIANFLATNRKVTLNWIPKVPKVSNAYTITSANDSKVYQFRDPRAWRLEGTTAVDPKSTTAQWVTLDVRQDQEFTTNYQRKIYDFPNKVAYTGYRLTILQVWTADGNQFQISEWTMNFREEE